MYTIESHKFEKPLFTYIETTYVLTLADQPERMAAMLERLRATPLTSTVLFIINPGAAAKRLGMNSCDDLLHTTKFACSLAMTGPRPAIILEDDCEFTQGMTRKWAKAAEAHCLYTDAIAFGAFMGISYPINGDWIRVVRGGVTHGMILTHTGMTILHGLPYTGYAHDTLLYKSAIIHAPRFPVGVQRHYRTKNSAVYDKTGLITLFLVRVLKSPSDPILTYNCSHLVGSIGGLYVLLAAVVAAVASAFALTASSRH